MTLQEAIGQVYDRWEQPAIINDDDYKEATNLLIEAGKARIAQRAIGYLPLNDLLPGETKE